MLVGQKDSFDPLTDPDRPVIGSVIKANGAKWIIKKVESVFEIDLLKGKPETAPYDEVLYRDHNSRPFVLWAAWVTKKQEVES